MRSLVKLTVASLVFAVCCLTAVEVNADPFVITSGTIVQHGTSDNKASYDFAGPGISVTVPGFFVESFAFCNPCQGGTSNTLSVNFSQGGGTAVINGVTFAGVGFNGSMHATTPSFVLPPGSLSAPDVTLTLPFTLTGNLIGCTGNPLACNDQLFNASLSGQGFALVHFQLFSLFSPTGNLYVVKDITFNFQPATSVPEPATLFLLGTGVTAFASSVRKRRRVSK
jgi:hypothetical protein